MLRFYDFSALYMLQLQKPRHGTVCPKKTPAQGGREVIEAGFIQARNLSSSALVISNPPRASKLKV